MPEHLGEWPPDQAAAVADALRAAGLRPDLDRRGDLVAVSVPSDQAGAATRALSARMDEIAAAVRADRRRAAARAQAADDAEGQRPLVSERLLAAGPWIAVAVSVLFVVALVPAPVRAPATLVVLAAIGVAAWWGRCRRG